MPELPLPKFEKKNRPALSLDEALEKGRAAAAATGQVITGDSGPRPADPQPMEVTPGPVLPAKPARQTRSQSRTVIANTSEQADRVRWDARVSSDLWIAVRKAALDRRQTPNDLLEEALRSFLASVELKR